MPEKDFDHVWEELWQDQAFRRVFDRYEREIGEEPPKEREGEPVEPGGFSEVRRLIGRLKESLRSASREKGAVILLSLPLNPIEAEHVEKVRVLAQEAWEEGGENRWSALVRRAAETKTRQENYPEDLISEAKRLSALYSLEFKEPLGYFVPLVDFVVRAKRKPEEIGIKDVKKVCAGLREFLKISDLNFRGLFAGVLKEIPEQLSS